MHQQPFSILRTQSGAALVIALAMMIVLTLIALASSFTSIFEIKISGKKRMATDAFYGADSGVQVVMGNVRNFDLPAKYDVNNRYDYSRYTDGEGKQNYNPTNADIIILHNTTQSGAPRGMGMSATGGLEFAHYLIESTGRDQTESGSNKSVVTIEQKVIRLVPTM